MSKSGDTMITLEYIMNTSGGMFSTSGGYYDTYGGAS